MFSKLFTLVNFPSFPKFGNRQTATSRLFSISSFGTWKFGKVGIFSKLPMFFYEVYNASKTTQRAAGIPWRKARSFVRCTHNKLWRTREIDPQSVPATTSRYLDNRRKFNGLRYKICCVSKHDVYCCTSVDPFFPTYPYRSVLYKI